MTWTTRPDSAFGPDITMTPFSGLMACMRSTLARTARTSTTRSSITMSPPSRTLMIMLLDSFDPSARPAPGRLTSIPSSRVNTAVMMKKISRFRTKSSIGARSMPVVDSCALLAPRLRRISVLEAVRQQFGLAAGPVPEVVDGIDAGDAHREPRHGADHGVGDPAGHGAGVRRPSQRHRLEHLEHPAHGSEQAQQRRQRHQDPHQDEPRGHPGVQLGDHRLPDRSGAPGRMLAARRPRREGLRRLPGQHEGEVPIALDHEGPEHDAGSED